MNPIHLLQVYSASPFTNDAPFLIISAESVNELAKVNKVFENYQIIVEFVDL